MKIETTPFSITNHGSQIVKSSNYGTYMLHNVDVSNEIICNGRRFTAIYQTSCSYMGNEYGAPSKELELSVEADSHQFLTVIEEQAVGEVDGEEVEWFREIGGFIKLKEEDVYAIYEVLKSNLKQAKKAFEELELSNDVKDWSSHYHDIYATSAAA